MLILPTGCPEFLLSFPAPIGTTLWVSRFPPMMASSPATGTPPTTRPRASYRTDSRRFGVAWRRELPPPVRIVATARRAMPTYRFSIAAAWALGGIGWLLVGLAFVQFAMALIAPPDPMFHPSGALYLWGAAMKAGMTLAAGLGLAVFGGVARAVFAMARRTCPHRVYSVPLPARTDQCARTVHDVRLQRPESEDGTD